MGRSDTTTCTTKLYHRVLQFYGYATKQHSDMGPSWAHNQIIMGMLLGHVVNCIQYNNGLFD